MCIYIYICFYSKQFGQSRNKCKRENTTINSIITRFPMYSEDINSMQISFKFHSILLPKCMDKRPKAAVLLQFVWLPYRAELHERAQIQLNINLK